MFINIHILHFEYSEINAYDPCIYVSIGIASGDNWKEPNLVSSHKISMNNYKIGCRDNSALTCPYIVIIRVSAVCCVFCRLSLTEWRPHKQAADQTAAALTGISPV